MALQAGALIVLALAWTLYLNHGIKDFEASLSGNPTTSTTQSEAPQRTPTPEIEKEPEAEVDDLSEDLTTGDTDSFQEDSEITDALDIHALDTFGDSVPDIDDETQTSEETLTLNELLDAGTPIATTVGPCGEVCEPSVSSVDILSLSKEERREVFREGLIRRFGDTPEVDRFIHYMKLADTHQTISEEEALENAQAIATLFPNEANKRHFQELELRVASRRTTQK